MWSAITGYAKLALCDGLARKSPEIKNGQPRRLRFEETPPASITERDHSMTIASSDDLRNRAEEIVKSNTESFAKKLDSAKELLRDGSESVKSLESVRSLAHSFWWEEGHDKVREKTQKRARETILLKDDLVTFLCASTTTRGDVEDERQTIMKTVEDACNVEFHLRSYLGGERMSGLAITGTANERERAKSMIVRLASSCRKDTLTTLMDAWDDFSSPCEMHLFMSDCAEHEFGPLKPLPLPTKAKATSEHCTGRVDMDLKSHRRQNIVRSKKMWKPEDIALHNRIFGIEAAGQTANCEIDSKFEERSPSCTVPRFLSRWSNDASPDSKLQSFADQCARRSQL